VVIHLGDSADDMDVRGILVHCDVSDARIFRSFTDIANEAGSMCAFVLGLWISGSGGGHESECVPSDLQNCVAPAKRAEVYKTRPVVWTLRLTGILHLQENAHSALAMMPNTSGPGVD
jgi:hypothetical protein